MHSYGTISSGYLGSSRGDSMFSCWPQNTPCTYRCSSSWHSQCYTILFGSTIPSTFQLKTTILKQITKMVYKIMGSMTREWDSEKKSLSECGRIIRKVGIIVHRLSTVHTLPPFTKITVIKLFYCVRAKSVEFWHTQCSTLGPSSMVTFLGPPGLDHFHSHFTLWFSPSGLLWLALDL